MNAGACYRAKYMKGHDIAMGHYSRSLKSAHWVSAGLVLGMAVSGMMYFLEIGGKQSIVAHQIMGQGLILVLAWRLLAKFRSGKPRHAHALWERVLAGGVQIALYGVLIAFLVSGYVAASALRDTSLVLPVDFAFARGPIGEQFLNAHYNMKWVLLGLLVLHIAGALKHHFIDRDTTLRNIWFTKQGD